MKPAILLLALVSGSSAQLVRVREARVNTGPFDGANGYPSMARLTDGRFVMSWQEGAPTDCLGRAFSPDGLPASNPFLLNPNTIATWQYGPAVAAMADGGFAAFWGHSYGARGQRFLPNLTPSGPDFAFEPYESSWPAVANHHNGEILVVGTDWPPPYAVRLRRYSWSTLAAIGDTIYVNQTSPGGPIQGANLAVAPNGNLTVTWHATGPRTIMARTYSSNGTPLANEWVASASTVGGRYYTAAVYNQSNELTITWEGSGPGDVDGVFARRFLSNGTPLGPEFRINETTTGVQSRVNLSNDAAGRMLFSWSSPDQNGIGSFGRLYDASAAPLTGEFQINSYFGGNQLTNWVIAGRRGNLIAGDLLHFGWGGEGPQGMGVYLTTFQLQGLGFTQPNEGQVITTSNVTLSWNPGAGATGYDITVNRLSGEAVFTGKLAGANSTSTVINLPEGNFIAYIRSCSAAGATNCGSPQSRSFTVQLPAPATAPSVLFPSSGAVLNSSTHSLSWIAVAGATSYQVTLTNNTAGTTDLFHNVIAPTVSTIFSIRGGQYTLSVRACTAGCGPAATVNFSVQLPAVPTVAPNVTGVVGNNQNQLTVSWDPVQGADLYIVRVVQPPPAGPGGGALTVASRQVSATSTTLSVPNGAATVFVQACNGDGCGPNNPGTAILAGFGNPAAPVIGEPVAGLAVNGPTVLITWSRIPGDNGSNTVYRLFVQDFSRQQPALDIVTTSNYWGAQFAAGRRYDALVIANPNTNPVQGPPQGFVTRGNSPFAPTMVAPQYTGRVTQGNVRLAWTPVPGIQLYQYYLAKQGRPDPEALGLTTGTEVQIPMFTNNGQDTVFSAIGRVCTLGTSCNAGSDTGWGPWSNAPGGTGVTTFTVTPGP